MTSYPKLMERKKPRRRVGRRRVTRVIGRGIFLLIQKCN